MKPSTTVGECYDAKTKHGFSGFPVTANGKIGSKLVGLVTARDVDFVAQDRHNTKVHEVISLAITSTHSYISTAGVQTTSLTEYKYNASIPWIAYRVY